MLNSIITWIMQSPLLTHVLSTIVECIVLCQFAISGDAEFTDSDNCIAGWMVCHIISLVIAYCLVRIEERPDISLIMTCIIATLDLVIMVGINRSALHKIPLIEWLVK